VSETSALFIEERGKKKKKKMRDSFTIEEMFSRLPVLSSSTCDSLPRLIMSGRARRIPWILPGDPVVVAGALEQPAPAMTDVSVEAGGLAVVCRPDGLAFADICHCVDSVGRGKDPPGFVASHVMRAGRPTTARWLPGSRDALVAASAVTPGLTEMDVGTLRPRKAHATAGPVIGIDLVGPATVVTLGRAGEMRIIDTRGPKAAAVLTAAEAGTRTVCSLEEGSPLVATGTERGMVVIYDLRVASQGPLARRVVGSRTVTVKRDPRALGERARFHVPGEDSSSPGTIGTYDALTGRVDSFQMDKEEDPAPEEARRFVRSCAPWPLLDLPTRAAQAWSQGTTDAVVISLYSNIFEPAVVKLPSRPIAIDYHHRTRSLLAATASGGLVLVEI
jgi:hypothetical protein